ncbi:MAG: DegV family protein [Chloroflexi bacterium]|nr:DegV family protein [Chloroflexota bacterium]
MTIRIVTDSTCDLPPALIAKYGITVVPLFINFGDQSYRDGVDISREEFYGRLRDGSQQPTTSAPGPGVFAGVYEQLAREGATGIISLHISSTLSNVVNVARLAAEEVTSVPVRVVDSQNLTLVTGLAAIAAAIKASEGYDLDQLEAMLNQLAKCTYCFAALDTVEYLRRSGRMSHVMSTLATLLQIKPLLKMNQGVSSVERVRTSRTAMARLIDLTAGLGPLLKLAVVHTNDPERAQLLCDQARHLFPADDEIPLVVQVTPVLGAHLGPGTVGFVAVTECEVHPPMERKLWLF